MFLDGLLQIFATQIFAYNVTRAVDQEIRRQSGNVICTNGRRVTTLEVAYADPWQLLLLNGIHPQSLRCVNCHLVNLQTLIVILIVYILQIGIEGVAITDSR